MMLITGMISIYNLGDFHAMMTFFGIIGTFISGSGFEEIVYQSGLCTPGFYKHATFREAL